MNEQSKNYEHRKENQKMKMTLDFVKPGIIRYGKDKEAKKIGMNCQVETKEEALKRVIKDFKSKLNDEILQNCIVLYDEKPTYYENSTIIDITSEILMEEEHEIYTTFLDKRTEIMIELLENFLKEKRYEKLQTFDEL